VCIVFIGLDVYICVLWVCYVSVVCGVVLDVCMCGVCNCVLCVGFCSCRDVFLFVFICACVRVCSLFVCMCMCAMYVLHIHMCAWPTQIKTQRIGKLISTLLCNPSAQPAPRSASNRMHEQK
jgi:hypothetical protein